MHHVGFATLTNKLLYILCMLKQRVTAVLRSIPKEAFADSFQKLYERCQPCVVKDGELFQGQ
jgi:hypothetical protein